MSSQGTQPGWPSNEAIRQCEEMKYYPSVFILKAGQLVHINKGRLHAFRKLAPSALPDTDCHSDLRNQVLQTKEKPTEDICFSVAWDWMFKGVTSDGINREVSGILECSRLNREHHLQSLAIPEASLLFLAKENIAKYRTESKNGASTASLFQLAIPQHPSVERSEPDAATVLQGILPSLHYVVNRHNSAVNVSQAWEKKTKDVTDSSRVVSCLYLLSCLHWSLMVLIVSSLLFNHVTLHHSPLTRSRIHGKILVPSLLTLTAQGTSSASFVVRSYPML